MTYFCPPPCLNLSDNTEPKTLLCSVLRTTTYQERLLLGAVPLLLFLQLVFVLAVQLPGHLSQHLGVGFVGGLHLQRHPFQSGSFASARAPALFTLYVSQVDTQRRGPTGPGSAEDRGSRNSQAKGWKAEGRG